MRARLFRVLLLSGLAAALTCAAHAEGTEGKDDTNPLLSTPKPAVHKRKPVKKAAPKPATPTAPVPYTSYAAGTAPAASTTIAKALTPSQTPAQPPTSSAPVYLPGSPLPSQPMAAPPPPAPAQAPRATPGGTPTEISLKCETRVTDGKKVVSQGSFFIDIFPSPVFPDEQADFKFMFVDPMHKSLVRETLCLDINCTANVTSTVYALVNRRTRHGDALRITLDRTNGAFYAEHIDPGLPKTTHQGEQGVCTPQKIPSNVLF